MVIDVTPQVVYARVSEVTRIGERSPECHTATWEHGVPGTVGAVFRGRNRVGWAARWPRRCQVTEAEPGRAFAFRTLPERLDLTRRDSTTWTYRLEATDHRDMRPQMRHNLAVLNNQLTGAPLQHGNP